MSKKKGRVLKIRYDVDELILREWCDSDGELTDEEWEEVWKRLVDGRAGLDDEELSELTSTYAADIVSEIVSDREEREG